jgi:hypothetical protein
VAFGDRVPVLFLVSEASSYITGEMICVDGGSRRSLHHRNERMTMSGQRDDVVGRFLHECRERAMVQLQEKP